MIVKSLKIVDAANLIKYKSPKMNKMAKSIIRNFGEAVKILEVMMRERGTLEVVSKTVPRFRSFLMYHFDIFRKGTT